MSAVAYKFLPWLREGAATLITTPDDLDGAAASFQMQAEVRFTSGAASTTVNLFGPADVVGLAKDQITRREPALASTGFEPNYFPSVEFRDADMPWRFTPTRAAGQDRLRPWLTLIAVEQRGSVGVRPMNGAPLPVIAAPINELPNPAELDRWAHVQVAGPFPTPTMDAAALTNYVRDNPGRALARLMCPRRLQPNSVYLLCLVPVFEIGRCAGLGEQFDAAALKLQYAWTFNESNTQTINLPVYDSWTVSTGPARDPREEFERLARALRPYSIPAEAATREFTVDAPVTTVPPLAMHLSGALRPVGTANPPAVPQDVRTNLGAWVNQLAQVEDNGGEAEVTPPIYGRWQSGRRRVLVSGTPVWMNDLNLDPRMRAVAAVGGDIVQRHQDEFIAEAWRQAGQMREANQLLRGAQMARSLNQALTRKHLEALPAGMLLQVAGPDRARIRHGEGTLHQTVAASGVPDSGVEATFRRVARVRGPHTRAWNIGTPDEQTDFLFRQGFFPVETTSWTAIDEGMVNAPSNWIRDNSAGDNAIIQTSTIHTLPTGSSYPRYGTMYVTGDPSWRDLKFSLLISSNDDDAVGVVFRFTSTTSYYRFSMNREFHYRRLLKRTGNSWIQMWEDSFAYTPGVAHPLRIEMEGANIRIFFNQQKIADLVDSVPLPSGRVGLYTSNNSYAKFTQLSIQPQMGLHRTDLVTPLVLNQGNIAGPSAWTTVNGDLRQTSDINSNPQDRNDLTKLGTYVKAVPDTLIPSWRDYAIRVNLQASDDDAIGVMFRYRNPTNFYRFSMDLERSYQRLVKCVDGQYTLLWQRDEGFVLNNTYELEVIADGSRLRGYLGSRKLFDLRDRSHANGTVAFYCWGNTGARFPGAEVKKIRRQGIMSRLNAGQLGVPVPPNGQLDLQALRSDLLSSLAPSQMVNERVMERLRLPAGAAAGSDPLAPLGRAPEIPIPLSTRLIEHAPELMLPGVGSIPENAVVPLETNPAFVAALLVGANHEMTRELLWRGPDTDLRATVFRQFWDVRGSAANGPQGDIQPIHTWSASQGLASQLGSQSQPGSVFLIRSELLRRFPDARFYMVQAVSNGSGGRKPGTVISTPQFRGRFGDDIAFFGFAQPPAEVSGENGGLGWYFVIEQRPDAGRFGLLLHGPEQPPDWTELGWNHVQGAAYARATPLAIVPPSGPEWGRNAAHMAAITQRRPFRLLMHAKRLLTSES